MEIVKHNIDGRDVWCVIDTNKYPKPIYTFNTEQEARLAMKESLSC